jgi:hypothetical protein
MTTILMSAENIMGQESTTDQLVKYQKKNKNMISG